MAEEYPANSERQTAKNKRWLVALKQIQYPNPHVENEDPSRHNKG